MDSQYLTRAKQEIEEWESQGPGFLAQIGDFILWPALKAAETLIPESIQERINDAIEVCLGAISAGAQLTVDPGEIRQRVDSYYRETNSRLEASDNAARHYWNYHIGYGLVEGGAAGAAGLPGLIVDIPALLTIAIRLIQQIGICYGFDVNTKEEQEYVMHILRTGSTGDLKTKVEFLLALKEIEQILLKVTWKTMNAALAARKISQLSLLAAVKQFARTLGIQITKRKALQMVPVAGALIGASFNAVFINDVGRAAYMSYRRSKILELEGPVGEVFVVFEMDRGNVGRRKARRKIADVCRDWNQRFAEQHMGFEIAPGDGHMGNFILRSTEGRSIADVPADLSRVLDERFAVFAAQDFLAWLRDLAVELTPTPEPPRGCRATGGAVMDLDPKGGIPPLPASSERRSGSPRWAFSSFAVARVRGVWKYDRLGEDGKALNQTQRDGGWGSISKAVGESCGGQWTARSLSTLEGVAGRIQSDLK